MGKITETKVNSHKEWLEERRKGIGGSDAATIVGLNAYDNTYNLWLDKQGMLPPKEENLAMKFGTFNEEFVARLFTEATGKKVHVREGVIRNSDYPFAHANVDRWLDNENAGLECKTTSAYSKYKFENGDYPNHYYAQCLHYMAVTGAEKYYLAVLIGNNDFRWFEINRDAETQEAIDSLMEAEKAFWNLVKNNEVPEFDGSPEIDQILDSKYTEFSEEPMELINKDVQIEEYLRLGDEIKSLTSKRNAIKQELKDTLGNSTVANSNFYSVTWKPYTKSNFDYKRFIAEHPEIDFSEYYSEKENRKFTIKEMKYES